MGTKKYLTLSADTLKYFSSNQLILVDTMLGNFTRVERVMEEGDAITNICLIKVKPAENSRDSFVKRSKWGNFVVAAYNSKYYRSVRQFYEWEITVTFL